MIDKEKMYEALELVSRGITRPTRCAKALGMSYRSYSDWLLRSNRGDARFLIEFRGETMQWAKALTLATNLALLELRGMLLEESIGGYLEEQTRDGGPVWSPDPVASAIDDPEVRVMLGYRADGLLVDDRGALVKHKVRKKSPFAQQIALLRAAFPDLRETQTVNQNVNLNGNVTVGIGHAKRADYSQEPVIPPPPDIPQLEVIDASFTEVDPDLEDLLGPVPQPAPTNITIAPEPEPDEDVQPSAPSRPVDAERTIREATPPEWKAAPPTPKPVGIDEAPARAPRNDLERDLFAKLAVARGKGLTSNG